MRPWLGLALVSGVVLAQPDLSRSEELGPGLRAVTLQVGQLRTFRVPGLSRVTGSSGLCVEEGLAEGQHLTLRGLCPGLRNTFAWTEAGLRTTLLVCVDEPFDKAARQLRDRAQKAVGGVKTVTACVRAGKVTLVGWADTTTLHRLEKAARDLGVVSEIEELPAGG